MSQRTIGALVAVLGLLVVLGGIVAGGVGISTGGIVTGIRCGTYFSPDLVEAQKHDESLIQRDWKDVLRGRAPSVGTETRDACTAALDRRALPVWAMIATGGVIALVGLVLALVTPGLSARVRAEAPGVPSLGAPPRPGPPGGGHAGPDSEDVPGSHTGSSAVVPPPD